ETRTKIVDDSEDDRPLRRKPPRRRRELNVTLLLITLAVITTLSVGGYFLYQYQQTQLAVATLSRAKTLIDEKAWRRAAGYLQRYLRLKPDDVDSRVLLVDVTRKSADTVRDYQRLSSILYDAIGRNPERSDLYVALGENLLDLGDYPTAYTT